MNLRAIFVAVAVALVTASGLGRADAHPPLPAGCSVATPLGCSYQSNLAFTDIRTALLTLTDAARGGYQVPLLVRYPADSVGPRPVVIWNHGGEPRPEGRLGSSEWSTAMAQAGYVVIHPSRNPITDPLPFETQCTDNGADPGVGCIGWVSHSLYGPQNTDFIIDNFATIQALRPALSGRLNANKVVVAGWSAGTTVALANAGAWRQFDPAGPVHDQKSTRPIGFMAVAPFGPDYGGFYYSLAANFGGFQSLSFDDIDERPFLFITGKGDYGPTFEPDSQLVKSEARTTGWMRATPGSKYLAWDTRIQATHGTVNISDCGTVLKAAHCAAITSLGIAYLDMVTRGRPAATSWLASDAFETLIGNEIELNRR